MSLQNTIYFDPKTFVQKEGLEDVAYGHDEAYIRKKSIMAVPLPWKYDGGMWFADTIIGSYYVGKCIDTGWYSGIDSHTVSWEWEPELEDDRFSSGELDMKRECEKHFEKTIKEQLLGLW